MANVRYSFSNPLKGYTSIKKELTMADMKVFRQKYEKSLVFKQSKFWIGSLTGFNQKNVKDTDYALCVSDALGHVYYFPYAVQNALLKIFDRSDSLGLAMQVTSGKPVNHFNWRQITVNNALIGYVLNMLDGVTSGEWNAKTISTYQNLNAKIQLGKVKGVFMPYYLAPKELKLLIKHSILASKGVFGIGALLLYDYSNGYPTQPCAVIPDIDFITQFDLTSFSVLGFGKMYQEYLEQCEKDMFGKLVRCDSPKPKDLPINKSTNTGIAERVATKDNKTVSEGKKVQALLKHLGDTLDSDKCLASSDTLLCTGKSVTFADNKLEVKLGLVRALSKDLLVHPDVFSNSTQEMVKMPRFKAKKKQKLNLNVIFTFDSIKTQFDYVSYIGLYGTNELCMQIGNGSIAANEIIGKSRDVTDFVKTVVSEDVYTGLIEDLSIGFDEQVLVGLLSGTGNAEFILKDCGVVESEDMYKVTFNRDSAYKKLEITIAKIGLAYKLTVEGNDGLELNFEYAGEEKSISEIVCELVKAAEDTLKGMTD